MFETEILHERKKGIRTLLQHPMIHASGTLSEEFGIIRRHIQWIRQWFARYPGWHLQDSSETIRLRKTPTIPISSLHPALDSKSEEPFTRRRYVLFCLALAVLEKSERQITLNQLAERIFALFQENITPQIPQISLDFRLADDRRDLVHAIRLLSNYQVLRKLQGDEQLFLSVATSDSIHKDVLYNIHRPAVSGMLNVKRGPSLIPEEDFKSRLKLIVEEPVLDNEEGRNRRIRSMLYRKLLEEPILYYDELTSEELDYLTHQRPFILKQIAEATGLTPEVRKEGIALLDEENELNDFGIPQEGTDGHFALLLAEFLSDHGRKTQGSLITNGELERETKRLIQQYKSYWRKSLHEPGMDRLLLKKTLVRLESLKLVFLSPEGVVPRPALARYRVDTPVFPTSSTPDLFSFRPTTQGPNLPESDFANEPTLF